MIVLCILTLLTAVGSGIGVFGSADGAGVMLHIAFVASVLGFLASVVALIARSATSQMLRDSDSISTDPHSAERASSEQ